MLRLPKKLLREGMSKVVKGRKYIFNKNHRWVKAKLSGIQQDKLLKKYFMVEIGVLWFLLVLVQFMIPRLQ